MEWLINQQERALLRQVYAKVPSFPIDLTSLSVQAGSKIATIIQQKLAEVREQLKHANKKYNEADKKRIKEFSVTLFG